MNLHRALRRAAGLCACAPLILLAACADDFPRRDTISDNAGDFIAANEQMQAATDPWSRAAFERRQPLDGQKAMSIAKSYRQGQSQAQPGSASAAGSTSSTTGSVK